MKLFEQSDAKANRTANATESSINNTVIQGKLMDLMSVLKIFG